MQLDGFSFGDVFVTSVDIDSLAEGEFVTDIVISFYFECLERWLESCVCSQNILVMSPSTSFLVQNSLGPLVSEILQPLCLKQRRVVICTVTNNIRVDVPYGGSHWSLLVFVRDLNLFFHFDSANNTNKSFAQVCARNLRDALGCTSPPEVKRVSCPQQTNSYDCGLYCAAYARCVIDPRWPPRDNLINSSSSGVVGPTPMLPSVSPNSATASVNTSSSNDADSSLTSVGAGQGMYQQQQQQPPLLKPMSIDQPGLAPALLDQQQHQQQHQQQSQTQPCNSNNNFNGNPTFDTVPSNTYSGNPNNTFANTIGPTWSESESGEVLMKQVLGRVMRVTPQHAKELRQVIRHMMVQRCTRGVDPMQLGYF